MASKSGSRYSTPYLGGRLLHSGRGTNLYSGSYLDLITRNFGTISSENQFDQDHLVSVHKEAAGEECLFALNAVAWGVARLFSV